MFNPLSLVRVFEAELIQRHEAGLGLWLLLENVKMMFKSCLLKSDINVCKMEKWAHFTSSASEKTCFVQEASFDSSRIDSNRLIADISRESHWG